MTEKKAKPDKKVKAKKKTTATAKKNPNRSKPLFGNQNAKTWTDEDIQKLAKDIADLAPEVCSIVEICYKLKLTQGVYYDLVERYPPVSESHNLAKAAISMKAWKQSYEGKGFPNVLTMAIKYHDVSSSKTELEQLKASENAKADVRIREKKELAEKIEEGNGNVLDEFDEFLQWKAAKAAKKKAV